MITFNGIETDRTLCGRYDSHAESICRSIRRKDAVLDIRCHPHEAGGRWPISQLEVRLITDQKSWRRPATRVWSGYLDCKSEKTSRGEYRIWADNAVESYVLTSPMQRLAQQIEVHEKVYGQVAISSGGGQLRFVQEESTKVKVFAGKHDLATPEGDIVTPTLIAELSVKDLPFISWEGMDMRYWSTRANWGVYQYFSLVISKRIDLTVGVTDEHGHAVIGPIATDGPPAMPEWLDESQHADRLMQTLQAPTGRLEFDSQLGEVVVQFEPGTTSAAFRIGPEFRYDLFRFDLG